MFGGLILKKSIKNIMGSIPVESKIYFKNYLIEPKLESFTSGPKGRK